MMRWRAFCQFIFKYIPAVACLAFVIFSVVQAGWDVELIWLRRLFGLGLTPYIVLFCASVGMGFCRLHRAIMTYDFAVSIIATYMNAGRVLYIAVAAIGVVFLAHTIKKITGQYGKDKERTGQVSPCCD